MASSAEASALVADIERRTAAFARKDREYGSKIALLEAELSKARSSTAAAVTEAEAEKQMDKLRGLHSTIVTNIEHVQEQTARVLQEQEKDLLRAFRARLLDVQTELEKERAKCVHAVITASITSNAADARARQPCAAPQRRSRFISSALACRACQAIAQGRGRRGCVDRAHACPAAGARLGAGHGRAAGPPQPRTRQG